MSQFNLQTRTIWWKWVKPGYWVNAGGNSGKGRRKLPRRVGGRGRTRQPFRTGLFHKDLLVVPDSLEHFINAFRVAGFEGIPVF